MKKGNNGTHSLIKGSGPFFSGAMLVSGRVLIDDSYGRKRTYKPWPINMDESVKNTVIRAVLLEWFFMICQYILLKNLGKLSTNIAVNTPCNRHLWVEMVAMLEILGSCHLHRGPMWHPLKGSLILQPSEFLGSKLSNSVSGIPTDSKNIYTQMLNVWYIYQHLGSLVGIIIPIVNVG